MQENTNQEKQKPDNQIESQNEPQKNNDQNEPLSKETNTKPIISSETVSPPEIPQPPIQSQPPQTVKQAETKQENVVKEDVPKITKTFPTQGGDPQKGGAFEQPVLDNNFSGDSNFFPRIGEMFGENEVMPDMPNQALNNYSFNENNENNSLFQNNFLPNDNFNYGVPPAQMGGEGSLEMMDGNMMYQDMAHVLPRSEYGDAVSQPDSKLCPARLSMDELQKELNARGLVFSENDKVSNVARLVNYLVDREYGESDLSSNEDQDYVPTTQPSSRKVYTFLEVILINCDSQRKPLLDWLNTWRSASKDVNAVEIVELSENNLIKIRIFNKFSESSGVVDQLNSVKIKCARYYCYSRGDSWGGWEYYEDGVMQKKESYDAERLPPLFWKRLCWLENVGADGDKMRPEQLTPEQVCAVLGTDEEMICVDCGNFEKRCRSVHGSFNGHFKSKDLYNRYATLISPEQ